MRYFIGIALLACLLPMSAARAPERDGVIHARPVALDRDRPERRDYGALRLLAAWKLTSDQPLFGGLSSMRLTGPDSLLAVSDRGTIFHFRVRPGHMSWPLRLQAVPAGPGPKKDFGLFDRDIESMAYDPESGRTWLGYEFWNSIWRYAPGLDAADGKRARPPEMRPWPENGGPEAMVRLRDGRFLLFSEEYEPDDAPPGATAALLFQRDPLLDQRKPVQFAYLPPQGFRVTDAAQLPDGRVLVLNRHFSVLDGVAAAVTLIDPTDIRPGRTLTPRLVARFASPLTIDNMEALAIESGRDGPIVWIGSDDNFNLLQQTLLLKFTLDFGRLD